MYLLILIQQIIASFTHIIAKEVTTQLEPTIVLFFRSFFAAFFFAVWVTIRRQWRKIDRKDLWTFILLGALNIPINQYLFLVAIKITTAPNIALAYAVSPIFVFIIAHFFLKESTTLAKLLGIIIAVIGTGILLAEQGFNFSSDVFIGNILGGLASFAWALYTIFGRDISRKYGAIYSTSISMQIGFALYLIMFIFLPHNIQLSEISVSNWLQIGYLGIFTSGIGYALWYSVLKKMDASKISVFNNLQPLLTTILAMIFLKQVLTIHFVIGGILILIGVYVSQKK